MKAAVLYKLNKPLIIEEGIELPALKPGQLLVKIAFSGVCRSQLFEVQGLRGEDKFLPHLLGHEGSGKVVAVGGGVNKIEVDDYVVLGWIKGQGADARGAKYTKDGGVINGGPVTTFNEFAVVSENRCVKLPSGFPLDIAVLFGCAIPTGAGIVMNEIELQPGNSIAVFGIGGIGLSALVAIRLYRPRLIIAVDVDEKKLVLAKEFGATHLINSSNCDPTEKIFEITNGVGVDFSIEAAGLVTTIEQAFNTVRTQGGLSIFASHPQAGDTISLDPHALISGKQIRGTWGGSSSPDRDIPRFVDLYNQGKLPLERFLSHRYSLENINQALLDLDKRGITRALIEIDSSV